MVRKGVCRMPVKGKHAKADSTKSRMMPWLVVAMIACALIVAQTLSFITREIPLQTKVQFGDVGIVTHVLAKNAEGAEVEAADGDNLGTHDAHVSRILRVENTGDHPVFVRLKVGFEYAKNGEEQGKEQWSPVDAKYVGFTWKDAPDSNAAWITRPADSEGNTDGFFYLNKALPPKGAPDDKGALSDPLNIGIDVDTAGMIAAYGGDCTFRLVVKGYGVQSENQKSENVLDAEGWAE